MHAVLPSELAYRIVQLALALEEAQREHNDARMGDLLAKMMQTARALRDADRGATE